MILNCNCLFSDLAPGQEVFNTLPFCKMVCNKHRLLICDNCLKPTKKHCAGCKRFMFCCKTCQIASWKSHHKIECKLLKNVPLEIPNFVLFLARCLMQPKYEQALGHLESNLEKLDEEEKQIIAQYVIALRQYLGPKFGEYVKSSKQVMELACQLKNNMFVVNTEDFSKQDMAMAIYPDVAMTNHQCASTLKAVVTSFSSLCVRFNIFSLYHIN